MSRLVAATAAAGELRCPTCGGIGRPESAVWLIPGHAVAASYTGPCPRTCQAWIVDAASLSNRCHGLTARGEQCRRPARGLCPVHRTTRTEVPS